MRAGGTGERSWPLGVALALALGLALSVGLPAQANISLPGSQHVGDEELGGGFVPLDPVLFDRMTAYPTHFHLTEEVTVTKVRFQGLVKERAAGRPYVAIDGTDYAGTWDDGTDTLTLDSPPTLAAGLHTLAVTSDCINSNTNQIVPCSGGGNKTEHDLAFSGLTLVTQTGAGSVSRHWVRRRHIGDNSDDNDDFEDLTDPNQDPFWYPDANEGNSVTLTFNLASDTYFGEVWLFRLRDVDFVCFPFFCLGGADLSLDGTRIATLADDSPDMQDSPYVVTLGQTLSSGQHTLTIEANSGDDISWDSLILQAPGPGGGGVALGDFNAFESDTPTGSAYGPIYTKVAGQDFQVDVVHLNNGGNPQNFRGDVDLELVDATSGPDCESLNAVADLGTATFSNQRRVTATGRDYPDAIASARIRATEADPTPPWSDPEQGCSQDTFTIRPHHLTLSASDQHWDTPGTDRTLDTATTDGTPIHKAGYDFTLQGQAVVETGSAVEGFGQTGFLGWALSSLHDGDDTLGSHSPSSPSEVTFPGDGDGFQTDSASYREVGSLELTLTDQGNFVASSGDKAEGHCVSGSSSNSPNGEGKYGCQTTTSSAQTVGRFVPGRFEVTDSGFAFERACSANFTYFGQPFPWSGTPTVTITAVEQGGNTTTNYEDGFWKLADYTDAFEDDSNTDEGTNDGDDRALDPSGSSHAWPSTTDANGQIAVDYSGTFTYTRGAPEVPIADGDQVVKLRFDVEDSDGVGYEGGSSPPTYLISSIGGADPVRFGRLHIANAHGPDTEDLAVPLQAQYYTGTRFQENSGDACTGLSITGESDKARIQLDDGGTWVSADTEVALEGGTGGTTEAIGVSGIGSGNGEMTLEGPRVGNTGYVQIRVDLGDLPWLEGDRDNDGSYDDNPRSRAFFGRYRGDDRILFWREVYQ